MRSLGVQVGMSKAQVEGLPGVVVVSREPRVEQAAEEALHTISCAFSPRIEAINSHPGAFALDIQGMSRLFANATELATKLRQSAMSAGFLANVAASANLHAALCLAQGRSGVSVVEEGGEAQAIASLPLNVLPLSKDHQSTFSSWGVRTCGQLAALSSSDLVSRLGSAGAALHALARGEAPHLMAPIEPSFEAQLVERMDLDHPIEELEPLLFLLSRMTSALLSRVASKSLAISALRVLLRLDGDKQHQRTVKPALPLEDTPTLLKLLQLDLEMHPPDAAILVVELSAQSCAPYRAQHGLFLPQAPAPGQTEVLLARLTKLLGDDRVGSPELVDDHRPNAFRMVSFAPPPPRRIGLIEEASAVTLRVARPPQMIRVAIEHGVPTRVFWGGAKYTVLEAAGPERVSGQWWTEASWCREEWDVRLGNDQEEQISRIAYDPRSRCWYAQGPEQTSSHIRLLVPDGVKFVWRPNSCGIANRCC